MKYVSKQFKRLKNKFKDIDLFKQIEKRFSIYSHGGKIERSFKQRLGKRVNKDWEKRFKNYNTANQILKKIEDRLSGKQEQR